MPATELSDLASAVEVVHRLRREKTEAEAQIDNCMRHLANEQQMLSEVSSGESAAEATLVEDACLAGIKAWKLSIAAYRADVEYCEEQIKAVAARFPLANAS